MAERQIVLVDMDDVFAGFKTELSRCIAERHPEIALQPRRNFYTYDDYPLEHREKIKAIANEPGFFLRLPIEPDSLEGIQRIIDLGHQPKICTAPLPTNPTCEVDKLTYIERNLVPVFGRFILETAVITPNKHEVDGIALVDDKPKIPFAFEASWTHVVFDKPWNEGIPGFRLYGWLDPNLEVILSQLSQDVGG